MDNKKIKLLFIIPSLRAGGAERVMSYLSVSIDKLKFESTLVVIGYEKDKVYEVPNSTIYLNKDRVQDAFFPLIGIIYKLKPHIVFSAIAHLNIMIGCLALAFPGIKFVGREVNVRSVIRNYSNIQKRTGILGNLIAKLGYCKLEKVICQSVDMANDLLNNYNFPPDKIIVINNPISKNIQIKENVHISSGKRIYKLITVGRLEKQKGYLRVIDALSKLELPFHYTIIGDGTEKDEIMKHAKNIGIYNKITHIQYTDKVFDHLAANDLFLLGSYVEGFPNALLESCAIGTPVVAFKAPGGIDEIVQEGINGFLAADTREFTQKVTELLMDLEHWKPNVVSKSVYDNYSSEIILSKYENLFFNIIDKQISPK